MYGLYRILTVAFGLSSSCKPTYMWRAARLLNSGSGPGPDQLQHLGIGRRHPAFPIQCSENQAGCCCHISPFSSKLGLAGVGMDQIGELIPSPV